MNNIKNLVTISLMIFIALFVIILGAGVFFKQGKTTAPALTPLAQQSSAPAASAILASEVARHNSSGDCWVTISNKVYNVTNLIPIHTGGADKIIPYCGKDATTAFATKNGRGSHSQNAQNILNNYYVGNLSR
jgi:cytochrome b involved in lipid metabolism